MNPASVGSIPATYCRQRLSAARTGQGPTTRRTHIVRREAGHERALWRRRHCCRLARDSEAMKREKAGGEECCRRGRELRRRGRERRPRSCFVWSPRPPWSRLLYGRLIRRPSLAVRSAAVAVQARLIASSAADGAVSTPETGTGLQSGLKRADQLPVLSEPCRQ